MQNLKSPTGMKLIWVEFFSLGVCKVDTCLIWGYAWVYTFDLGVRVYQTVENPWAKGWMTLE